MARNYTYYGKWTEADEEEFRRMRTLDHPNLNKFLGVSISGNTAYMIWAYNERGSLMEVIKTHTSRIDSFIMVEMMKNIIEAIYYLHNSPFKQHGSLNVYRCGKSSEQLNRQILLFSRWRSFQY
jgi:serine/threonine protein kinase